MENKNQKILDSMSPADRKKVMMSNAGEIVANNRANRRKFPPDDPDMTKATWSRQSRKEIKRKRKLGRK